VTHSREPDEPIDDQVPVPDAVEQRQAVDEIPDLSEDFEPTEASAIAERADAPVDANPADWQEQLTSADTGPEDWES
jgi:hypothetical protein